MHEDILEERCRSGQTGEAGLFLDDVLLRDLCPALPWGSEMDDSFSNPFDPHQRLRMDHSSLFL